MTQLNQELLPRVEFPQTVIVGPVARWRKRRANFWKKLLFLWKRG
jgi:hypothetical protein